MCTDRSPLATNDFAGNCAKKKANSSGYTYIVPNVYIKRESFVISLMKIETTLAS